MQDREELLHEEERPADIDREQAIKVFNSGVLDRP
jgi:hypothetical protein